MTVTTLNKKDLELIIVILELSSQNDDERFDVRKRCRELHDRIQGVLITHGHFVSVD